MVPTWDQVRERLEKEKSSAPLQESLSEKFKGREGVEVRPLINERSAEDESGGQRAESQNGRQITKRCFAFFWLSALCYA